MIYLGQMSIKENTNSSTKTFTIPEGYKGAWVKLSTANGDASYGYIDNTSKAATICVCNLADGNAFERAYIVLDTSTRIITITFSSKSNYQKNFGNSFVFWGVK